MRTPPVACPECGHVRKGPQQPVCRACSSRRRAGTCCILCGTTDRKTSLSHSICDACAATRRCSACGAPVQRWVHCHRCKRPTYEPKRKPRDPCARCGEVRAHRGKLHQGQRLCPVCIRELEMPATCEQCGAAASDFLRVAGRYVCKTCAYAVRCHCERCGFICGTDPVSGARLCYRHRPGFRNACVGCGTPTRNSQLTHKCVRCLLIDEAMRLFGDNSGTLPAGFDGVLELLLTRPLLRHTLAWVRNISPALRTYLRSVANGDVALTDGGLRAIESSSAMRALRWLLSTAGVLDTASVDKAAIAAWLREKILPTVDRRDGALLLEFLRFQYRPAAYGRPLVSATTTAHVARTRFKVCAAFLQHLAACGVGLASCPRRVYDVFCVQESLHRRSSLMTFLRWAHAHRRFPFRVSASRQEAPLQRYPSEKVNAVRARITDTRIPTRYRLAAALIQYHGMMLSDIAQLGREYAVETSLGTSLHLPWRRIPIPVWGTVRDLLLDVARAPGPLFFPSPKYGKSIGPVTLAARLRSYGLANASLGRDRMTALRTLRESIPGDVERLLGISQFRSSRALDVTCHPDWLGYVSDRVEDTFNVTETVSRSECEALSRDDGCSPG